MAKKGKVQAEKDQKLKEEVERWKEYFGRVENVLDNLGGKGTFALIPKDIQLLLYTMRSPALKIVKSDEFPFPNKILKILNRILSIQMKYDKVNEYPNNFKLSVYDFVTVWLSMNTFLDSDIDSDKIWRKEFVNRLSSYFGKEKREQHCGIVDMYLDFFLSHICKSIKDFMWIESVYHTNEETASFSWTIKLRVEKIIAKQIQYHNETRTIYPVLYAAHTNAFNLKYRLKALGIESAFSDLMADVYIMEHAINRLNERMKPMEHRFIKYFYQRSMCFPVIHVESANKFLIEYQIMDIKAGYFIGEYINGLVLIKTFLFLTNNGTPEGRKLNELTGLSKVDKKYLHIDELSVFLESDIEQNEHLKQLFIDAGCEELFKIKDVFENMTPENPSQIASFIDQYLTTGVFNEDFELDDDE